MDGEALGRGGEADAFHLPWCCQQLVQCVAFWNTRSFYVLNACCGISQSIGFDFPSCVGANLVSTAAPQSTGCQHTTEIGSRVIASARASDCD